MNEHAKNEHDCESRSNAVRRQVLLGGSAALGLAALGTSAAAQVGVQQDWRYCSKCDGLFWNGAADKGRCAGGGGHIAQGFQFQMHYDAGKGGAGGPYQYDWRFCSKCKGMFYDGSPNKGRCPAGKGHTAQGFMFGVNINKAGPIAQSDWRFCQKCNDLFWSVGRGACAAGGTHVAQGFMFALPFLDAKHVDVTKVIVDAVSQGIPAALQDAQPFLLAEMGRPNLLGKGYSLHKMNLRFAQADVRYHAPTFEVIMNDNYLYTQVTQPSVLGSYADPAFEIHFDIKLRGEVQHLPNGKLHVQNMVAEVPHILVKPRDVTGAIVTTVVKFYQMTGPGGRKIQETVDKYLRLDLTARVNRYLDTFS